MVDLPEPVPPVTRTRPDFSMASFSNPLGRPSCSNVVRFFRKSRPDIGAIILTEYADVESAVDSMKIGALDYVSKSTASLDEVLIARVKEALSVSTGSATHLEKLIAAGESVVLEFKSSLRWDARAKKANKELEKVIIKTIAAFLNSYEESNLLIGIADDGTVTGIMNDYKTLGQKQNRDGFENHLISLICDACGKECATLVNITFHDHKGNDICQVTIRPSPDPVFVKDEKGEHLFVRTGNSTRLLTTKEALRYSRLRWGSQK